MACELMSPFSEFDYFLGIGHYPLGSTEFEFRMCLASRVHEVQKYLFGIKGLIDLSQE